MRRLAAMTLLPALAAAAQPAVQSAPQPSVHRLPWAHGAHEGLFLLTLPAGHTLETGEGGTFTVRGPGGAVLTLRIGGDALVPKKGTRREGRVLGQGAGWRRWKLRGRWHQAGEVVHPEVAGLRIQVQLQAGPLSALERLQAVAESLRAARPSPTEGPEKEGTEGPAA